MGIVQRAVGGLSQGECAMCGAEPGCNIDCPECRWVADAQAALASPTAAAQELLERVAKAGGPVAECIQEVRGDATDDQLVERLCEVQGYLRHGGRSPEAQLDRALERVRVLEGLAREAIDGVEGAEREELRRRLDAALANREGGR